MTHATDGTCYDEVRKLLRGAARLRRRDLFDEVSRIAVIHSAALCAGPVDFAIASAFPRRPRSSHEAVGCEEAETIWHLESARFKS